MHRSIPRLIVAESDRFLRESLCMGLGGAFEYAQAASSQELMDLCRTTAPDAVLLSSGLVGAGVEEMCSSIRKMPGAGGLPVYIYSDNDEDSAIHRAFDSGANDYLVSPVHLGILARRIRRDIRNRDLGGPLWTGGDEGADSALFRSLPEAALLCSDDGEVLLMNDAFASAFDCVWRAGGRPVQDLMPGLDIVTGADGSPQLVSIRCRERGQLPVRVRQLRLIDGPWTGRRVFFVAESSGLREEAGTAVPDCQASLAEPRPVRVLVLEDYEVVSRSIRRLLDKSGHSVDVAVSDEEALRLFRNAMQDGNPFGLVILDLSVPGSGGGAELLSSLRAICPGIRAIVMSGAWNDPVMRDHARYGFDAMLRKPFSRGELRSVVGEALSAPSRTGL